MTYRARQVPPGGGGSAWQLVALVAVVGAVGAVAYTLAVAVLVAVVLGAFAAAFRRR